MGKSNCITVKFATQKSLKNKIYNRPIRIIEKAINELPKDIYRFVEKNRIMFSVEYKDAEKKVTAFCLRYDQYKNRGGIIHLSYKVWKLQEDAIMNVIYHEIAHLYLGHKGFKKSWENQANKLAAKWLVNLWEREDRKKVKRTKKWQ